MLKRLGSGVLLALLLLACSFTSIETSVEREPLFPIEPTIPPSPTPVPPPPSPTPAGPTPQAGTANVIGRLFWNSKPVVDVEVRLCEEVQFIGGCQGREFVTRTDAEGVYFFVHVLPGEYALVVHALDGDGWLYMSSGLLTARKYTVRANEVLSIADQHIYKSDLQLLNPADGGKVDDPQPTLSWQAYPEAAYYEIYLNPEHGKSIYTRQKVEATQITPPHKLMACKYTWKVEAFNSNRVKIAESRGYQTFYITAPQESCYIQVIEPLDGAQVAGKGLMLQWKPHETAFYYKLLMWKDETGNPKVLDFVQVRDTTYTLPETLKPGRYVWSIYAYDNFGEQIAGSGVYDFTVR